MKFAAGITLYNPKGRFIDRLKKYASSFEILVVNDNSPNKGDYCDELMSIKNIKYVWDGSNYGLPFAFNRTIAYCIERGVDYLCTLDQDSNLGLAQIMAIKNFIENHDMGNTAIVAPSPKAEKNNPTITADNSKFQDVDWVICSGSFINLSLISKKHIHYDEAYFVDRFDVAFCMDVQRKGLRITMLQKVVMPHTWGDEYGHTPLRHYYIFRNRFYFNNIYFNKIKAFWLSFFQTLRHIYDIMINEDKKIKKMLMLPIGYCDYKNKKMGRVHDETLVRIKKILEISLK